MNMESGILEGHAPSCRNIEGKMQNPFRWKPIE